MITLKKLVVWVVLSLCLIAGLGIGYGVGRWLTKSQFTNKVKLLTSQLTRSNSRLADIRDQANYNEGALATAESRIVQLNKDKQELTKKYEDSLSIVRHYTNDEAERAIARYYARTAKK